MLAPDTSYRKPVVRAPNGIRTRVTALKGRRPRPLDDGGAESNRSASVRRGRRNYRVRAEESAKRIRDCRQTGRPALPHAGSLRAPAGCVAAKAPPRSSRRRQLTCAFTIAIALVGAAGSARTRRAVLVPPAPARLRRVRPVPAPLRPLLADPAAAVTALPPAHARRPRPARAPTDPPRRGASRAGLPAARPPAVTDRPPLRLRRYDPGSRSPRRGTMRNPTRAPDTATGRRRGADEGREHRDTRPKLYPCRDGEDVREARDDPIILLLTASNRSCGM